MEHKRKKLQPHTFELKNFVRKYIDDIPSHEFDSLLNQISYLDHYRSLKLRKSYVHHIDEVIRKAMDLYHPLVLYSNTFFLSEGILEVDVIDFGNVSLYRSRLCYPNKKYRLTLNLFDTRAEAEDYLVDKLSDRMLLQKIAS
jgi:hypothetical protein